MYVLRVGWDALGTHSGRTTDKVSFVDKSRLLHPMKGPRLSSSGGISFPVLYRE